MAKETEKILNKCNRLQHTLSNQFHGKNVSTGHTCQDHIFYICRVQQQVVYIYSSQNLLDFRLRPRNKSESEMNKSPNGSCHADSLGAPFNPTAHALPPEFVAVIS